jgi:hypothetical protein
MEPDMEARFAYLLPLTAVFLSLALGALAFRARKRRVRAFFTRTTCGNRRPVGQVCIGI